MTFNTIPLGGHPVEVSPGIKKAFFYGLVPFRTLLGLYTASIIIGSVADSLDIHFVWALLLLVALFFKREISQNGEVTTRSLIPAGFREPAMYGLFTFALSECLSQEMDFQAGAMLLFVAIGLALKLAGKVLAKRKASRDKKSGRATNLHQVGHDVTDVDYREQAK